MLAAPDAGHNHMQVVDFLRINFRQHAREEIGLFLVVAFQHNPVAGASRFSSTLTNWSVGMTLPACSPRPAAAVFPFGDGSRPAPSFVLHSLITS